MQNGGHIYLEDNQFFSLARYGDQLNRSFGRLLRTLSRFFLGIFALILLVPFALLLVVFTTVISRIAIVQTAKSLKNSIPKIDNADERELMKSVISLEELSNYMHKAKRSINEGGKVSRFYFLVFFGSGLDKCLSLTDQAIEKINNRVYPNRDKELSEEQINELLVAYDGFERV